MTRSSSGGASATRTRACSSFSAISRGRVVSGPRAITGPPNAYSPAFANPRPADLLAPQGGLHRRDRRTGPPGPRRACRPAPPSSPRSRRSPTARSSRSGRTAARSSPRRRAPGATASAPATRLSAPGGFARSPQLAFTPDGHAVAVWTQSDGAGRALVSAARQPGGAFGPPTEVLPVERAGPHASARWAAARATSSSPSSPRRATSAPGRCRRCAWGPTASGDRGADSDAAGRAHARRVAGRRQQRRLRRLGHRRDRPPRRPRRAHRRARCRHRAHRLGLRRTRSRAARLRDDAAAGAR